MTKRLISQFMWGYQEHFRRSLASSANSLFKALGIDTSPKALLVGVRRPDSTDRNPVCVEPEDGEWSLSLFSKLPDTVENCIKEHELQGMFYSDEASRKEKPERIRRDSIRQAVQLTLASYDSTNSVRSFCGMAEPVGQFYVVPVIQVPEQVFLTFPPLREPIGDPNWPSPKHPSYIHAALAILLSKSSSQLLRPDPGRGSWSSRNDTDELLRQAASIFMGTPGSAIKDRNCIYDLFEQFNVISSLFYEGWKGVGRLILAQPGNPAIQYALRLTEPVPFRQTRWARKTLQMASEQVAMIADCANIYGLGSMREGHDPTIQDHFIIEFLDHYFWQLKCGDQVLLRSRYGIPELPQEPISAERFQDNFQRLFPLSSTQGAEHIWRLFEVLVAQRHGSMIIVAEDAEKEAARLAHQGSAIEPILLSPELLARVSSIDGAVLIDPQGVCHAIGLVLDGVAQPGCTPSRGSRYNSAIRYVTGTEKPRLAIVASDDETIDLIPLLPPRISYTELEANISALESATLETYHRPRHWLDEHRLYLNKAQCARINPALDRIENFPLDEGQFVIQTSRFQENPELDAGYFLV